MKTFVRQWKDAEEAFHWQAYFLSFVILLSGVSFAQLSTASLNGAVRDPSGAVAQDASVMLRNVDTGVEHSTVSNRAGAYLFLSITPGKYTVQASSAGFAEQQVP